MLKDSIVCGIVNVTPDSFYDGGRYENIINHGRKLIEDGADWLDIGGESTRPGAALVSEQEELDRVIPVIEKLYGSVPISIDTTKGIVAREAHKAGAEIINDVRGFQDLDMQDASKLFDTAIVMHSRGRPQTMQSQTTYTNVFEEVRSWLLQQADLCHSKNVILDPGIGFAKQLEHNITLMQKLADFSTLPFPIMLGSSRKSFIGHIVGQPDPANRLAGSLATVAAAWYAGVRIFRVHDVRETKDLLQMLETLSTP